MTGRVPYHGHPPFVEGSDTSELAADSVVMSSKTVRQKVFDTIAASMDGLTCDQLERLLRQRHQTISARVRELDQMGMIYDSGDRRRTSSGRLARVYRLAPDIPKQSESARPQMSLLWPAGTNREGD